MLSRSYVQTARVKTLPSLMKYPSETMIVTMQPRFIVKLTRLRNGIVPTPATHGDLDHLHVKGEQTVVLNLYLQISARHHTPSSQSVVSSLIVIK